MTMFTAIWTFSGLIVPPLFGWIADSQGDSLMFLVAGMWATAFLGGWLALEHRISPVASPASGGVAP